MDDEYDSRSVLMKQECPKSHREIWELKKKYEEIYISVCTTQPYYYTTQIDKSVFTLWMMSGHSKPHLQVPSVNR